MVNFVAAQLAGGAFRFNVPKLFIRTNTRTRWAGHTVLEKLIADSQNLPVEMAEAWSTKRDTLFYMQQPARQSIWVADAFWVCAGWMSPKPRLTAGWWTKSWMEENSIAPPCNQGVWSGVNRYLSWQQGLELLRVFYGCYSGLWEGPQTRHGLKTAANVFQKKATEAEEDLCRLVLKPLQEARRL